ncbi:hypothetical protein F0L74_07395 [Chitinophaga agrisoli]|uniref:DUF1835 domain-containing protein n=1 Tax=Chitinophaga agrisoli TaxID=2607653 RepID=A0A5B2W5W4_9BACT|nr:hypothetical protein [Chitinophaga agrisoli]KAA2245767.1 hypothetical protein F0L74_07395 [Chitinophaga agrisoli]
MSYLHVLNGDATLTLFRQSDLPGEIVVCREMMCEGKVKYTDDMAAFFETRSKHLEYHYGIDRQTYFANVVKELERLKTASDYEEVVLWFEFDLFCQINLLFILHYLRTQVIRLPKISLVSIDSHPEVTDFRGLGLLMPYHFPALFEQRIYLEAADMELAARAWKAYCQGDPLTLETISRGPTGHLIYLGPALQAHLQRLPSVENGLNAIQAYFLRKIYMSDLRWYDLYAQFWDDMRIYGFGDFQLDIYIQRMRRAGMIEQHDVMLSITSLGREVLNNEEKYTDYVSLEHRWLGGLRLMHNPWRWDAKTGTVVRVEE